VEAVMAAFAEVLRLDVLLLIAIGVTAGIIAGCIPGFTITMGVALTLPFTFGMEPIKGIATMMAVAVGGSSGGLISGCLLGIPGTPSSIATTFDGYPMSKNGEPGKALATGLWASFIGSVFAGIMLVTTAPVLSEWALKFGPWEYFSLMLFGMTAIASLAGDSILKGLFAGCLGLLLACVGMDPVLGVYRFTMDIVALYGGFNFLPVLIGLFAFSQLLEELVRQRSDQYEFDPNVDLRFPVIGILKEFSKQKLNLLRSSIIGTFIGALPAAGGSIANIMSYDQAKKASKYSEKFGTGIIDGIIASEAANTSCIGGTLIPMLAFGIPGDAVTAMILGALLIHGIQPGPLLLQNQPVLGNAVFVSFFIAAFFMLLIQSYGIRLFLRINQIPQYYLIPLVLALCALGSYAINNRVFDVWVLLGFGMLGFVLKVNKYPLAPVILGIILGPMMEANLRRAIMTSTDLSLFFTRPISLVLILLSVFSIAYAIYGNVKAKARIRARADVANG